jgi:replicative DNA helicase
VVKFDPRTRKPQVIAIDVAGRVPPHNEAVEAAVLSAILTDSTSLDAVLEVLPTSDAFYGDAHRRIFDAILAVKTLGRPVDVQTVAAELRDRDRLQAVGGVGYLVKLVDATPSVANVAAHATIVRDKARVRRAIETAQMIAAEGFGDYGETNQWLAKSAERLASIAESAGESRMASAPEIAREVREELVEQWEGKREPWGMRAQFSKLHALMHGFGVGQTTYVAADTGGGKSVFAQSVAQFLAAGRKFGGEKIGAAYLTLEMPRKRIAHRGIVMLSQKLAEEHGFERGLSMHELMTGCDEENRPLREVAPERVALVDASIDAWRSLLLEVDDADKDITKVRSAARKAQARLRARGARLRLLVVDHMHIMEFPDAESEAAAIAKMVREFGRIAVDLDLHLMVLAQYNRDAQKREGRPVKNDIRGAAAIEQIAHKILHIYRPWLRMSDKSSTAARARREEAEFILDKHRDGPMGVVQAQFIGERFLFAEKAASEGGWT